MIAGLPFVVNGKFTLSDNPYRSEPNTVEEFAAEVHRHEQCHHAYCLKCKHVQLCEPDQVFVCSACGWTLGEAIP
jgi:hypothetical protein